MLISQQKEHTGDDITPILLKKKFVTGQLFSFVSEEVRNGSFHSRSSLMKRVFKLQARNQGGVHGVRSHPPTGPKGPSFDTQYPS